MAATAVALAITLGAAGWYYQEVLRIRSARRREGLGDSDHLDPLDFPLKGSTADLLKALQKRGRCIRLNKLQDRLVHLRRLTRRLAIAAICTAAALGMLFLLDLLW